MSIKLKPCPFCGGEAEIIQFVNPKNFYRIGCEDCRCGTDGFRTNKTDATNKENIKANADVWNQRTGGVANAPDE